MSVGARWGMLGWLVNCAGPSNLAAAAGYQWRDGAGRDVIEEAGDLMKEEGDTGLVEGRGVGRQAEHRGKVGEEERAGELEELLPPQPLPKDCRAP